MTDIVLIAESYGSMLFAPEVPCLIVQWHGFAARQQFQSLMNRGLALYSQEAARTQPLGWLADTRLISAITPADQLWLDTSWNPRAYAAGVRHISFVQAENVFGQIAVQNYTTNTTTASAYHIELSHHRTMAAAKHQLQQALQQA